MPRPRMTDPGVRERLQEMLAAGKSKEEIAQAVGVSRQTVHAWIEQLGEELRRAVIERQEEYAVRLTHDRFRLYDELAAGAMGITGEIERLRALQEGDATPQVSLAIFRGYTVLKGYLDRMGELLGQLQPQPAQSVHLTRVEQLLNITVPTADIPAHLRPVVLQGEHRE